MVTKIVNLEKQVIEYVQYDILLFISSYIKTDRSQKHEGNKQAIE